MKWFTINYYTSIVDGNGYGEEWRMDQSKHKRYIEADSFQEVEAIIQKEYAEGKLINLEKSYHFSLLNMKYVEYISISEGKNNY